MSVWSRRFRDVRRMSGLPPTSDVSGPGRHFAVGPKAVTREYPAPAYRSPELLEEFDSLPLWKEFYSITTWARAIKLGEISIPIALAVFKLTTRITSVGCSTGKSPGFAPSKIRFT